MARTLVENFTSSDKGMKLFQQEGLILEITEKICSLMQEKGVSKSALAKRLHKTKGYITQLLDGRANMTLRTVSDVMWALDCSLQVVANPLSIETEPVHEEKKYPKLFKETPDYFIIDKEKEPTRDVNYTFVECKSSRDVREAHTEFPRIPQSEAIAL